MEKFTRLNVNEVFYLPDPIVYLIDHQFNELFVHINDGNKIILKIYIDFILYELH